MVQALAVIQVLLSMALVGLILMTRLTVLVGILFVANCIALFHALR